MPVLNLKGKLELKPPSLRLTSLGSGAFLESLFPEGVAQQLQDQQAKFIQVVEISAEDVEEEIGLDPVMLALLQKKDCHMLVKTEETCEEGQLLSVSKSEGVRVLTNYELSELAKAQGEGKRNWLRDGGEWISKASVVLRVDFLLAAAKQFKRDVFRYELKKEEVIGQNRQVLVPNLSFYNLFRLSGKKITIEGKGSTVKLALYPEQKWGEKREAGNAEKDIDEMQEGIVSGRDEAVRKYLRNYFLLKFEKEKNDKANFKRENGIYSRAENIKENGNKKKD